MAFFNLTELHAEIESAYSALIETIDGERYARYTLTTEDGGETYTAVVTKDSINVTAQQIEALIADHDPDALEIQSDKATIADTGADVATLSLRLTGNDGITRSQNVTVTLDINGELLDVALTNGLGTAQVASVEAGTLIVQPVAPLPGTVLEIEVG